MKKRRIAIVTGTRAEFGIWRPVLEAMGRSKKILPQLIVTGMHLQKQFGRTVQDIRKAGVEIAAEAEMYRSGGSGGAAEGAAESLARGTKNLAWVFEAVGAEMVMVLGDRLEMLAAAGAALALQIPMGHVHGGETAPGQWDEQIRHAITKMAHVHFCATKQAGERIVRMGEEKGRVHVVGAPALDGIVRWMKSQRGAAGRGKRAIVLLHPTSADERVEEKRARRMIEAVKAPGFSFVVIGPNNDPGSRGIVRAYERMGVDVAMSLPVEDFWNELRGAGVLVGNSSSGIIEAASFGIPVVNIGDRQKGRERNGNVMDVAWEHGRKGIERAMVRAVTDREILGEVAKRNNLYGDGRAAERIVRVLEGMKWPLGTTKAFCD